MTLYIFERGFFGWSLTEVESAHVLGILYRSTLVDIVKNDDD